MRKVVVTEYVTLDGVIENPTWTGPYWNDEIAKFKFDELFESDALLLGRVTYEGFAKAWPSMTDEQGFADRMNSLPKHVASRTLETTEWNASLIKEDVAEAARPRRRISAAGLSGCPRAREASLQSGKHRDAETCRHQDVRLRRRSA